MIKSLIFVTQLLGPLSQIPQRADSTYVNPEMCPSRDSYIPTPTLFCRFGNEKWHEQGSTCHDNPAERKSSACECHLLDVPNKRIVTYCKTPEGF